MLWVTLAIVGYVYIRYYTTPCKDMQIVQTSLRKCTPDLLAEKRPVVLEDRVLDHGDLLGTVFKFQFVTSERSPSSLAETAYKTPARFTLLFLDGEDVTTHVDIVHPVPGTGGARVVLRRGTTLVVPPRWTVTPGPHVSRIELYDSFHAALRYLVGRG